MNIRRASNGGAVTRGLAPGEKKKKKARKEGRHTHIPGGAERRERNEKKKKKIKPIVWCERCYHL